MVEGQGTSQEKFVGGEEEEGSKSNSTSTAEGKKSRPILPPRSPSEATAYSLLDSTSPPAIRKPILWNSLPGEPEPISYYSPAEDPIFPDEFDYREWLLDEVSAVLENFRQRKMARPQLIFVDGSLLELAQEMADYLQVGDQVKPLLEKEQNEDALQAIVKASGHLNSVPEKEFTASYNLLIHLVLQSKNPKKYLPTVCGNLLKPITSSPVHGVTLAANALSTIFNLLEETNPLRYNVFMQILRFIKQHSQYDLLKPRLKNLTKWASDWDLDEEDERSLYVEVADIATDGGDNEESYRYLLKALGTFDRDEQEEITSEEAQKISLRALRMALLSPTQFDFHELRALPTVQALSDSHPVYSQLLDIFAEQDLEDYSDFNEEHEGFIEKEKLDHEKLQRKMRLLTFASLAASTPNREIPYQNITKALQVPAEDVEMWTIDVIRAKLVEGRLSQQKKVFLVHRTTYRVFGEKQWRELGTRVDQYKTTVDHLITVIRRQQVEVATQKEREVQEMERKLANVGMGGAQGAGDRRRGGGGGQQKSQPQRERDDNDD